MTEHVSAEVVLNAGAGTASGAQDLAREVRRHFAEFDVRANVISVRRGEDLAAVAQQALKAQPSVVVAGGGDGTLNTVAGVLVGTKTPFGVLPLGTLNHFAKDAGIPFELRSAVETICRGSVAQVDVGRVNGRIFLNNSSLGLYPQVVRKRDQLRSRLGHGKWSAALWAAAWVFRRYPFFDVRIVLEGKTIERRTPLVFIGNNSYELDGLRLGERKCLDAGHLSVHIVDRGGRLGLVSLALRALVGRLREAKDFETFIATHLELSTRKLSASVAVDGEVRRMATPLVYELESRSLSVMVPKVDPSAGP